MDDYEFQAAAARLAIAVCRGEITVEEAVVKHPVEPCVVRNHTCVTHGNNSGSCEGDRDGN